VQTRPKPAGQLILSSEQGDPLLIWWRYGRGISVAFTSDAQSRWAAAWVRWPGFGRFWTRLVRHAMRKDDAEDFVLALAQRDGRATIVLDAADPSGRLLSGADVSARVLGPDRAAREISLPQTAPGRYAADFPARAPGRYLVEANVRYGGQTVYSARRGLAVGYADELRTRPTNVALLQSLAASTGGTFQPKPAEVFGPDSRTVLRTVGLWHYLLLAAAIAFVLDVAVRRLVWRR